MTTLQGKTALITGGSSGIGFAAAQRLTSEGARVILAARRQPELDKATAGLGSTARGITADVANLEDLDNVYATISDGGGGIDILIASAGHVELQLMEHATPEHFDHTFGINARGTFFTVQRAIPLLNPGATIVLVSSGMNLKGYAYNGVYATSKAAIRSFATTWANELKDRGIRCNVLSPGVVDTPILDHQFGSEAEIRAGKQAFVDMIPVGWLAHPEEMANAIYFLASSQSSYITGFELVADGGILEI